MTSSPSSCNCHRPPSVHTKRRGTWHRYGLIAFGFVAGLMLSSPESCHATEAAVSPEAAALAAVGRQIFSESSLSADGRVACASCHQPDRHFTDGRVVAIGVEGRAGTRNTPTLVDVVSRTALFWDGRVSHLQEAVLQPFTNAREHGLASTDELVARVKGHQALARSIAKIYRVPPSRIEARHIADALTAYLRTLQGAESAFDRYRRGARDALSPDATRGLEVFAGRAQCSTCHRIEGVRPTLSDETYASVGIGLPAIRSQLGPLVKRVAALKPQEAFDQISRDAAVAALGRVVISGDPRDIGKFRTPSLRHVARTAPYMHDGSVPTLEAALDHELYYRGLVNGSPIVLTRDEREDLIAFLQSLTETR